MRGMARVLSRDAALGLVIMAAGVVGLRGSLYLPLRDNYTLGPGAAPLLYALGVISCSVAWLVVPRAPVGGATATDSGLVRRGKIFAVFCFALAALVYVVGFGLAIFLFTVLGLVFVENWRPPRAFVFAAAWAAALYVLFVEVLGVPLEVGLLFAR